MKKSGKFHIGLLVKISIVIAAITLAVSTLVSVMNYYRYLEVVFDVHSDYNEKICKTIDKSLTPSQWSALSDEVYAFQNYEIEEDEINEYVASGDYAAVTQEIQDLIENMNLQKVSVYVVDTEAMDAITEENFTLDDSTLVYTMMDYYPSGSEYESVGTGYATGWWENYEVFDAYRTILEGVIDSQTPRSIREEMDTGGMYLSEYYPIVNGSQVIAIIQVSGDAIQIEDYVHSFFQGSILKGFLVALILIAFAIIYFFFSMVRPLRIMRQEAEEFVQNHAELSDRLGQIHTHDEIQDLAESFMQMEHEIQDYIGEVEAVTKENARIGTELKVATKIQEGMLPNIFPPFPERDDMKIYASMNPAKEVGGDFYDFFFVDQNHLAMLIADVAGKGVPAALFMAISKSLIKTRAQMGGTLSEILSDVNHQLCDGNKGGMFVTVWMAIVDLTTGDGIAVNAGHEHPVRATKEKGYELVCYRHSLAVAALDSVPYRQHSFKLEPGDRIFVYTDGLPEAINSSEEAYGTERFMKILNENKGANPEELLRMITEDVERFKGEEPQFDDLTMLMFEYKGNNSL